MDSAEEINRLIAHSNTGATHLENDDFTNALWSFREALHASKLLVNRSSTRRNEAPSERFVHLDHFMIDDCAPGDWGDVDAFFYRHALQVPVSLSSSMIKDSRTTAMLSAIVIFNLALFHHRASMDATLRNDQGHDAVGLLRKAVRLYESLFPLLQRGDIEDGSTLFILHTLNNLGQAYRALDEIDNAEQCFRQVLSTLMYISTSDKDYLCGASSSSLECFFFSTSYLIFPHCAQAASAA